MYSANFYLGYKTSDERYLREDGKPYWIKHYAGDPTGPEMWTWDNFDASGHQIAESHWRGKTLLSSDIPDPPSTKRPSADKPPEPDAE